MGEARSQGPEFKSRQDPMSLLLSLSQIDAYNSKSSCRHLLASRNCLLVDCGQSWPKFNGQPIQITQQQN